ncbi:MAG: 3-oxoacyl-[acyl-carrier-protein] synthase III C-terminal domain-containing protein [Bdellovibrionota bacterium]
MSKILCVSTVQPGFEYTTAEIVKAADELWLSHINPDMRRIALKIFAGADIQKRQSAFPLETVFASISFEEKNNLYIKAAIDMAERALKKALADSGTRPEELDFIVTTSCTGFMIPSVDAYLIDKLGLNRNIKRLPVTEMGCAAGVSALMYANDYLKAHPNSKAAVVSVELPSITFQKDDFSMENLVSTAIFADGAAAVILGRDDSRVAPVIVDTDMYHFANTTHLMGYELRNSGLKIVLDRDVPDTIQEHFPKLFLPFLERNNLKVEDIHNYMFHPGGKKIINRVEEYITQFGKDISDSKAVLKERGNLSSATILHILERILMKPHNAGELGYMLAFGPGFSGQSILLKWE